MNKLDKLKLIVTVLKALTGILYVCALLFLFILIWIGSNEEFLVKCSISCIIGAQVVWFFETHYSEKLTKLELFGSQK